MTPTSLPYPPVPLTDGVVTVRPWAEVDVDCVRSASADPAIPRGTTVPAVYTPDEGLAFVRRQWSRAAEGVGVSQAIGDTGSALRSGS